MSVLFLAQLVRKWLFLAEWKVFKTVKYFAKNCIKPAYIEETFFILLKVESSLLLVATPKLKHDFWITSPTAPWFWTSFLRNNLLLIWFSRSSAELNFCFIPPALKILSIVIFPGLESVYIMPEKIYISWRSQFFKSVRQLMAVCKYMSSRNDFSWR